MPESSKTAVRQLEDLASPIAALLRERCDLAPNASIPVDDLWATWKSWCEDNNRSIGTKAVFGRNLAAAQPAVRKGRPWKPEGEPRHSEYQGNKLKAGSG
jgi:putative DNA primase/helicase